MEKLPKELVLDIAEQLDIESMKNFMSSCQDVQALVKTHELSISNHKVSSEFSMPPAGNVLSSATVERHVLRPGTLNLVAELERRAQRADELLGDRIDKVCECRRGPDYVPGFEAGARRWYYYQWTEAQRSRHNALMRRGLGLCERIADVAANAPAPTDSNPTRTTAAPDPERWSTTVRYLDDAAPMRLLRRQQGDPFLNLDARPHQLAFVRALPADDVLALFYFVAGCGEAFQFKIRETTASPVPVERITVFEECVLRNGSYFLWAWAQGPQPRGREPGNMNFMSQLMIDAGLSELTNWESGKPGSQPGLRMTLISRFREVCLPKDDETGRSHVTDRMYDMINDLIFVDVKEKETEGALKEEATVLETDSDWDT